MEDEGIIVEDMQGYLYCAVYDGHGGRGAVDFVLEELHTLIGSEIVSPSAPSFSSAAASANAAADASEHAAMRRAFARIDRMLLQARAFPSPRVSPDAPRHHAAAWQMGTYNMGTTAAVCLCARRRGPSPALLHVANVGDTRAVLISTTLARRLSVDHLPATESERLRLQREGARVVNNRINGSLAVRPLGPSRARRPPPEPPRARCLARSATTRSKGRVAASRPTRTA